MLNTYTLHYFYITAQHLNFSRAAKHLYITQPALSKQIQQLEEQLQVRLFDRTKRSVKLTEAGHVLLGHCRSIFEAISGLESAMDQFRKEVHGNLRIAAPHSLGNYILPDYLKIFSTKYPQIMIHTIFKHMEEVVAMLRTGELDFGFLSTDETFDGLLRKNLGGQRMVFICSKNCQAGCPNASHSTISPKDLEACRFLAFNKQSLARRAIDALAREHHIHLNTVIESEHVEIIKSMVVRGMGGAIVPECTIREELKNRLITIKKIEDTDISRPISLYYKNDLHITKAHLEFLKMFDEPEAEPADRDHDSKRSKVARQTRAAVG